MKCFSIYSNQIKKRFDPKFLITSLLLQENKSDKITYKKLSEFLLTPPQYGANEVAVDWSENSVYRYIRITDIDECGNLKNNDIKTASYVDTKYELEENDILFARSGATAGKCLIYKKDYGKAIFAGYLIRFKINPQKLNPMFLFYYTQTKYYKDWVESIQRPAGQPNINSKEFCSLEIPVFSDNDEENLKIQENIISIMEQAYTLKSQYKDEANSLLISLNNLVTNELNIKIPNTKFKQYFSINSQNILNNRIDPHYHQPKFSEIENYLNNCQYKQYKIGDIAIKISSGATPLSGGDAYTDSQTGIPFIRSGDINLYDSINYENILYIKENVHNTILKSSQLQFEDILVAIVGATIGQVSMYKNQTSANINQAIALIRVDKNRIIPEYLKIYLLSRLGQEELNRNKRPVARANLNLEEIANINILIPDFQTQQNIIDKFNNSLCEINQNFNEARKEFEQAKIKIEKMILGEE